ncbi:septum formation inhibitor Maf [Pseudoalteromonas sp. NBT06-2]|uniref:Maf family protein n=1 Tax=Pseudoalteromonas sp. NBT06-2 TaxID=2025950 RepID=UPI000BA7CBF9|nr:Maf family protein [Pseudoalteromonas sp. NBT06-2]PAJ72413.1 septum formation inhibitor Maf [Pseudoalteromonas sp. NBT06-2]
MNNLIYLASASPRRKALLSQLNVEFEQFSLDVDESHIDNETPQQHVVRLACLKAQAGVDRGYKDRPVLGSDTIVVLDDKILGKPKSNLDAKRMLADLSGRTHQVMTAIAFANENKILSKLVITDVTFKDLSEQEICEYIATQEPNDKAGSYGIQGFAGRFVSHISGSYFSVVGLPLFETEQLLSHFWNE